MGRLRRIYDQTNCAWRWFIWRCLSMVQEHSELDGGITLDSKHLAKDGTQKLVFRCTSGEAKGSLVETVLIPMVKGREQKPRLTICVSSQVGCAMNCQFCFTCVFTTMLFLGRGSRTRPNLFGWVIKQWTANSASYTRCCIAVPWANGHQCCRFSRNTA